jgi:branched-subunit amino acid transport protein
MMDAAALWITIALMTLATIVTRASFFLFARVRLPARVRHALRYAPPVAFAAIVLPDILVANGAPVSDWRNPRLLGGIAATLFFLASRHLLGTIVAGMLAYTAARIWL